MTDKEKPTGLALLRAPFPPNQISKLPKATKAQTEAVKADYKKGIRCGQCGQWHHPEVVHLDYVGHAALTDRLLDVDQNWNWRPLGIDQHGLPALDKLGGLWIELTVCGQSRLGYGGADGKHGTDAIKELIGDALRNAAMRFGAALDLWHKGELHVDEAAGDEQKPTTETPENATAKPVSAAEMKRSLADIENDLIDCLSIADVDKCAKVWGAIMKRDGWTDAYITEARPKFQVRRDQINKDEDENAFPGDSNIVTQEMRNLMAG